MMKRFWESTKWMLLFVALIGGLTASAVHNDAKVAERKAVVCPSFLSIARSARDTLIVMRNEPLCNSYVLDNLR